MIQYVGGDPTQATSYGCAPDKVDFMKDLTAEQRKILADFQIGDLATRQNEVVFMLSSLKD